MKKIARILPTAFLCTVLLLSFAACGGKNRGSKAKKDQVVHVGETVQYGDLEFTFDKQGDSYEIEPFTSLRKRWICIHLVCKYNGSAEVTIDEEDFKIYADGDTAYRGWPSEMKSYDLWLAGETRSYNDMYKDAFGIREGYGGTMTSGRSSDLWLIAEVEGKTNKVEFDYVNAEYSDRWSKITFIVDLP